MVKQVIPLFMAMQACYFQAAKPPNLAHQEASIDFDASEYEPYAARGDASISGQAFFKTAGGEVRFAAGSPIFLIPYTNHSQQWFAEHVVAGKDIDMGGAENYVRSAVGDGSGRFSFEGIAPGTYYVLTKIEWTVPKLGRQGGYAAGVYVVASGEHQEVVVVQMPVEEIGTVQDSGHSWLWASCDDVLGSVYQSLQERAAEMGGNGISNVKWEDVEPGCKRNLGLLLIGVLPGLFWSTAAHAEATVIRYAPLVPNTQSKVSSAAIVP